MYSDLSSTTTVFPLSALFMMMWGLCINSLRVFYFVYIVFHLLTLVLFSIGLCQVSG